MNAIDKIYPAKVAIDHRQSLRATSPAAHGKSIGREDRQANLQTAPLDLTGVVQNASAQAAVSLGFDADSFLDDIRAFSAFDRQTTEEINDGVPYFTNAFWTSDQRAGSSLHQITYRGCFKPSLAEFFIGRLSQPGDVVHDPFMGRGTAPLQAALMGRCSYGSDINPLSRLMTRPRLQPVEIKDIERALDTVDWAAGEATRNDLLDYFHPVTFKKLESLRLWLARHAPIDDETPDAAADWIRMVALSRLTGHSPGYFSVTTLPPGQMTTIAGQKRMNARYGRCAVARDLQPIILAKSTALLRDGCIDNNLPHRLHVCAAWDTPWIESGSVDLVVTSPPFADVIDYGQTNWMKAWFAGITTSDIAFSHLRALEDWGKMIHRTLIELMRVVKPGGYISLEVGEIRKGSVDLARLVWGAAEGLPCDRLGVIVHDAAFTKASHINGVLNRRNGTNTNRVVMIRRH